MVNRFGRSATCMLNRGVHTHYPHPCVPPVLTPTTPTTPMQNTSKQDVREAAQSQLMKAAVKASLVADTGRPDFDDVRLHRCVQAKRLSVLCIPNLDLTLLVTTKATRPLHLVTTHTSTLLNTYAGQQTTCPPTPPCQHRHI